LVKSIEEGDPGAGETLYQERELKNKKRRKGKKKSYGGVKRQREGRRDSWGQGTYENMKRGCQ